MDVKNTIRLRSVAVTFVVITLVSFALPLKSTEAVQTGGLFRTLPEQRTIQVRSPEQLPRVNMPETPIPFTIATEKDGRDQQKISLDEAIQLAIQNAEVIRVLGGISAASSGRTIYDVAISNTAIDSQTAIFDPQLDITSTMNKSDRPGAAFDPANPGQSLLVGSSSDSINTTVNLSKRTFNGATAGINANWVGSYFEPGIFPLEPEYRSGVEMSLRQPFMRGYGRDVNLAPVVIARIDTERSYFQFKDTVQELVRGVINAYWNLVAARVDVWARNQQIEQAEFNFKRAEARKKQGLGTAADVAQARSALANFRASLITARSSELLSETALRNILGMAPSNTSKLVPTSDPVLEQVDFDWNEIVSLAEQYRPDIIELKLVLEADRIALMQANNQTLPQLDGIANYRWDGLSGEMPSGLLLRNDPGRFAGFNLGVNFSVPLGVRQGRAALRRRELVLAQDQANLDQRVHQMVHQLTINYRNLDQFFEQYVANKEAREAALLNYENQASEVLSGRREFINVLQAITDWGNSISQEARSVAQYNTELANVERQTGTILETHGIRFVEERYGSLGPIGLMGIRKSNECYPARTRVEGGIDRYPETGDISDDAFNLKDLSFQRESDRQKKRRAKDKKEDASEPGPAIETPRPNLELDKPAVEPDRLDPPKLPELRGKPINDTSSSLNSPGFGGAAPENRETRRRGGFFSRRR